MNRTLVRLANLLLLLPLAACGDRPDRAAPAEMDAEGEAATRHACAAEALVGRGQDDLQTLEDALAAMDMSEPFAEITQRATHSAAEFGRAYLQHAELRWLGYVYLDSAINHAPTTADSILYLERARSFATRLPQEGTLEANVLVAYQERLAALLADEDHPCNWDF